MTIVRASSPSESADRVMFKKPGPATSAQLLVQLVFFLHLGSAPDQRSNTGIFICTALLIAIIVGGSLWVTHNANANMMPTRMSVPRALSKD